MPGWFLCLLFMATDDGRTPVPAAEAVRGAEQLVRDLFKNDFARAKTPAEKATVAQQMLGALPQTNGAAERFVLLRVARDIAVAAGDVTTALKAADAIAVEFRVDAIDVRAAAFLKAAEVPGTRTDRRTVAKLAQSLARDAVTADRFELADALLTAALTAARTVDAFPQVREIVNQKKEAGDLATEFRAVERALTTLTTTPEDADAHLVVGSYRALRKGDWESGLPALALGRDARLRELATLEQKPPPAASDCIAIADGWWDLGQQAVEPIRGHLLARATLWYRWLEPRLSTGLLKVRVGKRAKEGASLIADRDWLAFSRRRGDVGETAAATPADRTEPPDRTDRPDRTDQVPAAVPDRPDLVVRYKCDDRDPRNNQIKPHVDIANRGRTAVPYEELTVRYWFTADGPQSFNAWCDHAPLGSDKVTLQFRRAPSPSRGADAYLEIGFKSAAGTLAPGKDSGAMQLRFARTDWSNVDEANDHSFDPAHQGFADAPRITLYRRGTLIWGTEPAPATKRP